MRNRGSFSPIATILLAVALVGAGLGIGIYAFISNSSPYRTVVEAKAPGTTGSIHVQAIVLRDTVQRDPISRTLRFTVKDEVSGDTLPVVYRGAIPESFDQAPKVVVVGSCKNGVFEASQIQTKCPSRYDAEDKTATKT